MLTRARRFNTFFVVVVVVLIIATPALLISSAFWAMRADDFRSGLNLKSVGLALKMYANGDLYPPLSSLPGRLMINANSVCPEMKGDFHGLISDVDPAREQIKHADIGPYPYYCFQCSSYFYLGYAIWNDETVEAFATAYRKRVAEHGSFDEDLPVDIPIGTLRRLSDATRQDPDANDRTPEREYLRHTDAETPVLIERPHSYPGSLGLYFGFLIPVSKPETGGLVLYQDGHVEFIPYPGKWPMTEKTISTLLSLETAH